MQQAQETTPKKHTVCMCITYTVIIEIIPTAMWAAHAMQAAHTVRPADQKPDYWLFILEYYIVILAISWCSSAPFYVLSHNLIAGSIAIIMCQKY